MFTCYEVIRITEFKDGCVWRTKSQGFIWLHCMISEERRRAICEGLGINIQLQAPSTTTGRWKETKPRPGERVYYEVHA